MSEFMDHLMRVYDVDELGRDGYPEKWHTYVKHHVRFVAGHRCVRCSHPFRCGETPAEWSPCDERCVHGGPLRVAVSDVLYDVLGQGVTARDVVRHHAPSVVEAAWRVLTVHHLDGRKANCRWWNLAALCQRCHLQIQGKVQMARVWPWEHSEWFQPYVAGYYAWVYLGEDLCRDDVEERLEELLALERIAA